MTKRLLEVSVDGGKYTVIQEADGRLHALRNGEPWARDLIGDQLVLSLAQELDAARQQRDDLVEVCSDLVESFGYVDYCSDAEKEEDPPVVAARAAIAKAGGLA